MKNSKSIFLLILSLSMSSCSFLDSIFKKNNDVDPNRIRTKEEYSINEFSENDINVLNKHFNFEIPFLANDSYDVIEYDKQVTIFYYDMHTNDFYNYFDTFVDIYGKYTSSNDLYGNKCAKFQINNTHLDLGYYSNKEYIVLNVYDASLASSNYNEKQSNGYHLNNANRGLPVCSDNLYNVDFTKEYIMANNANDLATYQYSCKATGNSKVLVIPVEFSDVKASDKGYDIESIKNAFYSNEETKASLDFYSVYDYFYTSSFNKLDLDIEVLDEWFMPQYESSYYRDASFNYGKTTLFNGEQIIMNEALDYLDKKGYDFTNYDSDSNNYIDAIVMINTLDIDNPENIDDSFDWAFRYYNYYRDENKSYYKYDGISANDYVWASYQFLYLNEKGDYISKSANNPYTYIHELSHVLGITDYYDYYSSDAASGPLKGLDIMDETPSDHNPFTKLNYGWIDNASLILNEGNFKLDAIENNGPCYILASDFDLTLGVYQEYYLICYYGNEAINFKYPLFKEPTIAIYHVDASLIRNDKNQLILENDNDSYLDGGSKNNLLTLAATISLTSLKFGLNNNYYSFKTYNNERIPLYVKFKYTRDGIYMNVVCA